MSNHNTILIIDDEADIRDVLADIFMDEGYRVSKAAHSEQALSLIKQNKPNLIILDIWLENSDMDGIEILKTLKKGHDSDIPVLMISGHGNIEMAVKAMKLGAFDFIEKPFKIDHILLTVQRALEQNTLKQENKRLREQVGLEVYDHLYKSPAMAALAKSIEDHAASDARAVIIGAHGTGKSRLARYLHDMSSRAHYDYLHLYASAIEEDSLTEDIFFDAYQGSTIIIEDIERLSQSSQAALLKILNHSGAPHMARLIVTTDQTIFDHIERKEFSSALWDRLSVIKFEIPDLHHRVEDIPVLIEQFAKKISQDLNQPAPSFSMDAIMALQHYEWTGNVRQLKMATEWLCLSHILRAKQNVAMSEASKISLQDVKALLNANVVSLQKTTADDFLKSPERNESIMPETPLQEEGDAIATLSSMINHYMEMPLKEARDHFERSYLQELLQRFYGNIAKMAEHIDMERTALHRKLKNMEIFYIETPENEISSSSTQKHAEKR